MKLLFKITIPVVIVGIVATKWDAITDFILGQSAFQSDIGEFINLSGMIAYFAFIVFAFIVQRPQFKEIRCQNKNMGIALYSSFIIITALALTYLFYNFSIQIALVLLMSYMFILAIYDFIGERIIQTNKNRNSHPKSLI